jgi:UrcA family protein
MIRAMFSTAGATLATGALVALFSAPVSANDSATAMFTLDNGARALKVSFADLNLATPQGNAALYQRLRYAAELVCESGTDDSLRARVYIRNCEKQAVAEAVESIGSPQLASLQRASTAG